MFKDKEHLNMLKAAISMSLVLICGLAMAGSKIGTAKALNLKFNEKQLGEVLEIGLFSKGFKTDKTESGDIYYTLWCVNGNVFMATSRYRPNYEGPIHPTNDNMVLMPRHSNNHRNMSCSDYK